MTTPAFMAFKDKDGNWVETGYTDLGNIQDEMMVKLGSKDASDQYVRTQDASGNIDNTKLHKEHFAPVRSYKGKADRSWSGTGSNVGPQVSGRVGFSDFQVERSCDRASPVLLEYCCTGETIKTVYLAQWLSDEKFVGRELVLIELVDSKVSSYETMGARWVGQRFSPRPELQAAHEISQRSFVISGYRTENVTFWFTKIGISYLGLGKGWDAGSNDVYDPPIM